MKQTLTAKVKIEVDPSSGILLYQTMQTYASACNFVSDYVFKTRDLSRIHLHDALYYRIRENFGLGSQMVESVIKTVIARYKTILENQKEWIRPNFKTPQADLVRGRDYTLYPNRNTVSIKTLHGRIRVPYYDRGLEEYFTGDYRFGTARLVFKHGKYFLHVPVSREIEELDRDKVTNVTGVDRGVRFAAVTYDSMGRTAFYSGKEIKQRRAHYKALREELRQKGTPSSRRRLKEIGNRENRWMNDVNHCIAKTLCASNPQGTMFVLEDFTRFHRASERVRTKRGYVSVTWTYHDLEQKLTYKARKNRQMVIKVSPAYTSQKCPACGHADKNNRDRRNHRFCCRNCGYRSNDDRVAAMNLQRKGRESLVPVAVAEE